MNDLDRLGDMLLFVDDTSSFACGKIPEGARFNALQTFTIGKQ